jgi:hypothetical protein
MNPTFKTKKGNLWTKEDRDDDYYESEMPDQAQVLEKEPEAVSRIPVILP